MSDLIIIGYDDEVTADRVLLELAALERDYLIDLEDAAVIRRDKKGKLHVTAPLITLRRGDRSVACSGAP